MLIQTGNLIVSKFLFSFILFLISKYAIGIFELSIPCSQFLKSKNQLDVQAPRLCFCLADLSVGFCFCFLLLFGLLISVEVQLYHDLN